MIVVLTSLFVFLYEAVDNNDYYRDKESHATCDNGDDEHRIALLWAGLIAPTWLCIIVFLIWRWWWNTRIIKIFWPDDLRPRNLRTLIRFATLIVIVLVILVVSDVSEMGSLADGANAHLKVVRALVVV